MTVCHQKRRNAWRAIRILPCRKTRAPEGDSGPLPRGVRPPPRGVVGPRGAEPPPLRGVFGSGGRGDAIMEDVMESSSDTSLSSRSSRRNDFSDTPSSRGVRPVSSLGVALRQIWSISAPQGSRVPDPRNSHVSHASLSKAASCLMSPVVCCTGLESGDAHLGVRAEPRSVSGPDLEDAKLEAGCTEPSPRRGTPPGFCWPLMLPRLQAFRPHP